jgi:high-affinity Fe2+/Pb2+ permease
MLIRETLALLRDYVKHEYKVFRTPLGLLGMIIAGVLVGSSIAIFLVYRGSYIDLAQGFAVELFGAAIVFATVQLLWESFVLTHKQRQKATNESHEDEDDIAQLRQEIADLKAMVRRLLPEEETPSPPQADGDRSRGS